MSADEHVTDEVEPPDEPAEVPEPAVEFGEQEQAAQQDEWEEDAKEGGG